MERDGIYKVLSIKDGAHHYSVEEMPGFWGMGRDYVIMHNRRRLTAERFKSARLAKGWLLAYLCRELNNQPELDLYEEELLNDCQK